MSRGSLADSLFPRVTIRDLAELAPTVSRAPVVKEDRALTARRSGDSGLLGLNQSVRERALLVRKLNA